MITRHRIFLLIFLTAFSFSLRSQEHLTLLSMEDSLVSIQRKFSKADNDSVRELLKNHFRNTMITAIGLPGSITYPFDSLKKMAKLTSPDGMFRIYNWNIPMSGSTNQYFCFLQIRSKENKNKFTILELRDRSDSIPDPEHSILYCNNWYGALYFEIIPERSENGTIYTLLGWEGKNLSEMQKIIEIMTFNDKNLPLFGKKIFNKYKDGGNLRVIFKYSPLATMTLRYEKQALPKGKKWNAKRRVFEESYSKASLIVCDRLVPVDAVEGKGPVLAPAGDVYDGFLFENSCWNFMEGVDARNR